MTAIKVLWVGRESGAWVSMHRWKAGVVARRHKHLAPAHVFSPAGTARPPGPGGGRGERVSGVSMPRWKGGFVARRHKPLAPAHVFCLAGKLRHNDTDAVM